VAAFGKVADLQTGRNKPTAEHSEAGEPLGGEEHVEGQYRYNSAMSSGVISCGNIGGGAPD
jgi:hypothetical protein